MLGAFMLLAFGVVGFWLVFGTWLLVKYIFAKPPFEVGGDRYGSKRRRLIIPREA